MNGGYTKLFSSIVASTIWREPDHVRLVWITMLAVSDPWGHVRASVPGLADLARVSIEHCEQAIATLSGPDKYSRTKDHDGRRIQEEDGGFFILNFVKHRDAGSDGHRREYMREYMRERRQNVNSKRKQCKPNSEQALTHTDTDTDTDTDIVYNSVIVDVGERKLACKQSSDQNARLEPRQRRNRQSDEEWLKSLESTPAYEGLDVRREHAKMVAWCSVNGKQPSRRRFVNWINRAERPMRVAQPGQQSKPTKPTAYTLKAKVEGLQAAIREVEMSGFESAFGMEFSDPKDKQEHRRLKRELRETMQQMSQL